MQKNKKRAFTLTELLVVVLVLGCLAAVSVPTMKQVLESRKTTEAEELLIAVRAEQEQRCILGKNYHTEVEKTDTLAQASKRSANYEYNLLSNSAVANSKDKDYSIKMIYKTGKLCCEGSYCEKLNKSYDLCSEVAEVNDECEVDVCDITPTSCSCEIYAENNACECNPSTENCCTGNQEWDAQTKTCKEVCEPVYGTPESANVSMCAEGYECEEGDTDTCDKNHSSMFVCDGTFGGTCVDVFKLESSLLAWEMIDRDNVVQTLSYLKREVTCCGEGESCVKNPDQQHCCDPATQEWTGSTCRNKCDDESYAEANPCECSPYSCECPTYASEHKCECNPSQSTCCTSTQLSGNMFYDPDTKSCKCPSGESWDSSIDKCMTSYTCITSVWWWQSDISFPVDGSLATGYGNWATAFYASSMGEGCGAEPNSISYCMPGERCDDCEPGKVYVWYSTHACEADVIGSHNKAIGGYGAFCLKCGTVTDVSKCATWKDKGAESCYSGSGSGTISGDFELGTGVEQIVP